MGIRTILAVPHAELTSPFVGLLRPVFELRSGETFKSNSRDYPNRGLVFTPSYYDEICDAVPPGYLVQLQVEENKSSSLPPTDPNYAKYIVCKNGWAEAERWAVQLVIEHPFNMGSRTLLLKEVPRHPIWLRDPGTQRLYGPFDTTARKLATGGVAVDLQPPDAIPFAPDREEHAVANISSHAVETEDVDGVEYLVFTRAEFAKKAVDWIDFSTDESVLDMVRELASTGTPLAAAQIEHLRNVLASNEGPASTLTKERIRRAAALLDTAAGWQERRHTLVEEYLATGGGAEHVARYLDAKRDELVDLAFRKHYAQVLERVQEHSRNLTDLAVQIKARKDELEDLQNFDTGALHAKHEQAERELEGSRDELARLREQINAGEGILDLQRELEQRRQTASAVQAEVEELICERDELAQVRDRLRVEAERDLSDLRSRLTSIKPYVDTLTGASIKQLVRVEVVEPKPAAEAPASLPALVDMMHESLLSANHRVAKRDVANVFTGILTSPLTILAGLPGVGKTSLVTRLADILGMAKGTQFLTVRVPRGWRGRQDILGYHNPITGEYERAPTGVYAMLEWHQRTDLQVPAWLLFDEANLSAPEHYLSDFLGMMDEVADRSLATGAPGEIFTVPDYLRFVFTINQDHSVEALTPRVLDRAAVVYVPPPDSFGAANTYSSGTTGSTDTLTMEQLRGLLSAVPGELNASEDATLKKVVKVLHDNNPRMGMPTRISPRKHRRVLMHTTTMRHILGVNAGLDALDHAIATHVLSLIRGSGKVYRARLDALARETESLPVSAGLLQRIIAAGEAAFDEYHFQTLA